MIDWFIAISVACGLVFFGCLVSTLFDAVIKQIREDEMKNDSGNSAN